MHLTYGFCVKYICNFRKFIIFLNLYTVVPALGDPRRERPPAVCRHFVNIPTYFKVKLPVISGHLPNADADSHLLVVSTCYNRQCKQMPRFRWSFQPKIAAAHPNLRPTDLSNFRAVVWWLWQCVFPLGISLVVIVLCIIARCIIVGVPRLPVRPWRAATCNVRTLLPGPDGVRSWQVLLYIGKPFCKKLVYSVYCIFKK